MGIFCRLIESPQTQQKNEKVKSWPLPSSHREVQQFLRFASYYRRFIKDFAQIARPLHCLTEKTASFQWNKECQDSFDMLRNKLISAPILTFPNYSQQFILIQMQVIQVLVVSSHRCKTERRGLQLMLVDCYLNQSGGTVSPGRSFLWWCISRSISGPTFRAATSY